MATESDQRVRLHAIVFHNLDSRFMGYETGNRLVPVFQHGFENDHVFDILNHIWWLLNVGDDPDLGGPNPLATEYRARRNRSLSVGDVVKLGDEWWVVADFGFETIETPADSIVSETVHGTTPIEVGASA